jgi:hypothetical protein
MFPRNVRKHYYYYYYYYYCFEMAILTELLLAVIYFSPFYLRRMRDIRHILDILEMASHRCVMCIKGALFWDVIWYLSNWLHVM